MASLTVISWRDIPSQIAVKRGRETAKLMLSHRFQEAVDRAAMRAGKTSSAAYIADWTRSGARAVGDDLQAEAAAEAARIEAGYSDEDLLRLIRAHGVDDTKSAPSAPAAGDV
jgi:Virulence factor